MAKTTSQILKEFGIDDDLEQQQAAPASPTGETGGSMSTTDILTAFGIDPEEIGTVEMQAPDTSWRERANRARIEAEARLAKERAAMEANAPAANKPDVVKPGATVSTKEQEEEQRRQAEAALEATMQNDPIRMRRMDEIEQTAPFLKDEAGMGMSDPAKAMWVWEQREAAWEDARERAEAAANGETAPEPATSPTVVKPGTKVPETMPATQTPGSPATAAAIAPKPDSSLEPRKAPESKPAPDARYGLGNIDLTDRNTGLYDQDGNLMTVRSMSFEENGTEILVPTVVKENGVWRELTDQEAIDWYHRTGEYLGKFKTPEEANAYAELLHEQQAEMYADVPRPEGVRNPADAEQENAGMDARAYAEQRRQDARRQAAAAWDDEQKALREGPRGDAQYRQQVAENIDLADQMGLTGEQREEYLRISEEEAWKAYQHRAANDPELVSSTIASWFERPEINDWEGRQELVDELKGLGVTYEDWVVDPDDAARRQERREEVIRLLREGDAAAGNGPMDYTFEDRANSVITGTGEAVGSSLVNAAGNVAAVAELDYADRPSYERGVYAHNGRTYGTGSPLDAYLDEQKVALDAAKAREREEAARLYREAHGDGSQPISERLWAMADKLGEASAEDLTRAKGGLSKFGQAGVDLSENLLEMGFDSIFGSSSLVSMAARTFGSSSRTARLDGASLGEQWAYGLSNAAVETFTEKFADGVAGVYGAGAADDIVEKVVGRLAETDAGRSFLRIAIEANGEGMEELVSGALGPLMDRIYKDESLKELYSQLDPAELVYEYMLGCAIGLVGGGASVVTGQNAAKNEELRAQDAANAQSALADEVLASAAPAPAPAEAPARPSGAGESVAVPDGGDNRVAVRAEAPAAEGPDGTPSLAGESRAVPDGGDRAESVISAMTPGAQQNDATALENAGGTDTGANPAEERTGESEALNSDMQSGEAGSTGVSTLQEQGSGGTIGTKAQPKLSANAAATDFRTKTGVGRQAETRKTVGSLAESLQAEGRVTEEIWNEAKAAAEKMLDESEDASFAEDGTTYKEMRDYLKKTGLKPSDELRGDSADYDAWRKSLYGRITFRNDGMAIDSAYQELADMFGEGLFPSNITGQRDQVDRILWALEAVRPKQTTAAQTAGENYERALNETTRELLAAAGNVAGMDLSGVAAPDGMQDEGARRFDEAVEATMFAFELEGDPLTWEEAMQLVKDFDGIDEAGLPIVPESDLNFGYSLDEYSVEEFEEDANETEAGGAHPEGVHSEMAAENAEAGAAGNEQSGAEKVRSGDSGPVLREDGQAAGGPAEETEGGVSAETTVGAESTSTEQQTGQAATQAEQTGEGLPEGDSTTVGSRPGVPGVTSPERGKRSQTESNTLQGVAAEMGGQQEDLYYPPITEKQTLSAAVNRVAADQSGEMENLIKKGLWTAEDVDTAMTIYGMLQADGVRTGDFSAAQTWGRVVRSRGTRTGQALQAFAKWTRSGAGMATIMAERVAEAKRLSEEEKARITNDLYRFGERFDKLNTGDVNGLRDLIREMADYRGTSTFAPKNFVKLLNKETNEDYLREYAQRQLMAIASDTTSEASLGERLKTWQVLSQLSRIGTFARNIGGNTVFGAQDVLVQNNIGVVLDSIIGKFTGRREVKMDKGWASSQVRKATAEAMRRSILEVAGDIDMSGDASRYGTTANRTNKASSDSAVERFLSRWEQLLSYSLSTSDATFRGRIESATLEGLASEVEAGHMTQEEAEQIARERADYRLFQNHGRAYQFSKGAHDLLNRVFSIGGDANGNGGFGLGDLLNPYPGVPANLAVKALEYSPANIVKGITETVKLVQAAKNGEVKAGQQAQAVMDIARGMTGAPLIAGLAALFRAGLIKNGDDEEDPDALAQNRAEGRGGVQINLSGILRHFDGGSSDWKDGDELLNIGWLEPANAFLAIASLMANQETDAGLAAMGKSYYEGSVQGILEMPVMQNLATLVDTLRYSTAESAWGKTVEAGVSTLASGVTGMLPAPVSQTARALDPYYRDLTGDSAVETALNTFYNALPVARERMLPVKTDTFGNPKENHPDMVQRFLNSFIRPGAVSELNQTEVSARTEAVYKATGEAAVYPDRNGPRSITIEGEKIGLSAAERRSYHETAGQETERLYSEFMGSSAWENMSDAQRATIMKGLKEFANDTAKRQYAEEHGLEYSSDWDDEARMADPVSYLAARTSFKDAEKARDYDAIDEFMEGWYGLPRETRAKLTDESTVYEALLGASRKGVSSETYFQVNDAVQAQTDAAGSTKGIEKFRGFVNSGADLKTMDALAESYLGSQAYGMYKAGRSSGLKPDQVLAIWEKADGSAGKAADGSISQQELYNALKNSGLTEAQKNAIWNSREWNTSYSEYKPK